MTAVATQQRSPVDDATAGRLVAVARPAPADLDPLALFAAAGSGHRFFWQQPGAGRTMVGIGAAATVTADDADRFEVVSREIRALAARVDRADEAGTAPSPRLVGGFAFDHRPSAGGRPPWPDVPAARLVLPEVTAVDGPDGSWLLGVGPDEATALARLDEAVARSLVVPGRASAPTPLPATAPGVDPRYEELVGRALRAIDEGRFTKVVTARHLTVDGAADAVRLLDRLRSTHRACTTFAVGFGASTFLGATPELLVSLHDDRVRTEAVAGTAARGDDPAADRARIEALLADPKERLEHQVVLEAIRSGLGRHGVELEPAPPTSVMTIQVCHHLHTPVTGRRIDVETNVVDLAGVLHPTPAVAGTPTDVARDWIRAHEGMDRGWYAGPVGWVDLDGEGEFRVALRSGLVGPERTHLFAGGGVVAGADPTRELAETAVKLRAVLVPLQQ